MTDIAIADVLAKIKKDIEWRGPGGNHMGHVVLTRRESEYLYQWAISIINERDDLAAKLESKT